MMSFGAVPIDLINNEIIKEIKRYLIIKETLL